MRRCSAQLGAIGLACSLALLVGCGSASGERPGTQITAVSTHPGFTDVTQEAGVARRHLKPDLDAKLVNIMPWMSSVGAAAAAGDYDNDGWIDLYVTSSRKGTPNALYRNNGDGSFTDVAAAAGLADLNDDGGTSMDSIWADLNNDGRLDLYLVRWGTDRLFHNRGDGTFEEVTSERFRTPDGAPGTPWANGNAVIALDYDLDGRLDLYVGNYFREVDLWSLDSTYIMHDSFETSRNAGPNHLWRQEADGTFTEVAQDLGVDDTGWTLAVGSADVNNDGWPDLYCANDFGPDQVFFNDGRGRFDNVSLAAIGPDTRKGMNVDFGDFNNDGWMDIYVTNITTAEYLQEGNMLWRNNGPGADGAVAFMDISSESGTYDGGWGWGAKFLDYDNDGDLDLFTVNGFVSGSGEGNYWYDLASWTVLDQDPAEATNWPTMDDRSFSGHESFRFWRNDGFESFARIDREAGLNSTRDGRGIAVFDYDNDGDVDIFVANQGQFPHLFRNDASRKHHWIGVRLEADPATGVNADAIGTRVTLMSDAGNQYRERDGGTGFAGQSDPRLHFGLGADDTVRLLEVRWPDGGLQYLENAPVDRVVTIRQDPDAYVASSLVEIDKPTAREKPKEEPRRRVPEIDREELETMLSGMEQELRGDVSNHAVARLYRQRCADYGRHDRAIDFFRGVVEQDPDNRWARLELSVAYVDKIPTCGGIATIVCKGTLARRSLDQLDAAIATHPDRWELHYGRGMNHLHWPRALRHTDDAIMDFERCLEMQEDGPARAYHERTYVLLGDARAKNGDPEGARQTWRAGLAVFADSALLKERLAVSDDAALSAYVKDARSLEQPIDTDFSFLSGQ